MAVSSDRILNHLRSEAEKPLKRKAISRALDLGTNEYDALKEALEQLEAEGLVYRVKGNRYAVPEKLNLVIGRLQTIRSGAGFVIPDEPDAADLFIPAAAFQSAMDGDRVAARIEGSRRGNRTEGAVIRVISRARETIVGTYHPSKSFGFVVPEDRKLTRDVFVPPGKQADANGGDVVMVRITEWGDGHLNPSGEVERVLGPMDSPGVDVLAVMYGHELPVEFPAAIEEAAQSIHERGMGDPAAAGRVDLRDRLTFTIDPADARDHDDALSIQPLGDGRWEVGVHIADVSHFVTDGSIIDQEARSRGTSVYLVDRVVPMLPEALSADLCSLRAGEDRFTLSLLMTLDGGGRIQDHTFVRGLIRCRHGLNYAQAQAVLNGEESIDDETDRALQQLRDLSHRLREMRRDRGSIDFDVPETRVILNAEGEPTGIERKERLDTHRIIEDFMLLANETVARNAAKKDIPFLYRIHEPPDMDRIDTVRDLVATFGVRLRRRDRPAPKDFQKIVKEFKDRPQSNLVSMVVLRSMKQARYSEENLGHFGLATWNYTHFTSPIRRYPDLMVHRLIARIFIDGEAPPDAWVDELSSIALHASQRERVAVSAERDSKDLKKVEYMERHIGDSFEGTISGVTSFGFFVLLDEVYIEGLVRVSSLEDDYYVHLAEQFALVGERTRRRFQLGDRVRIRVEDTDREERNIDFRLDA